MNKEIIKIIVTHKKLLLEACRDCKKHWKYNIKTLRQNMGKEYIKFNLSLYFNNGDLFFDSDTCSFCKIKSMFQYYLEDPEHKGKYLYLCPSVMVGLPPCGGQHKLKDIEKKGVWVLFLIYVEKHNVVDNELILRAKNILSWVEETEKRIKQIIKENPC